MIRVLQFGMSAGKGGIETYLINQLRSLPSDVSYDFINCSDGALAYEKEILKQGKIYNLGSRPVNPIRYYWRMLKLFYHIRNENYAAFILNGSDYSQDLPFLLARLIGIKCRIMHAHGSGYENDISFMRKNMFAYNRLIVKFCVTEYWACSKKASEFLFGHRNAFIVHNAIDVDGFRYNKTIRRDVRQRYNIENKFVIGHVGRFSPVKNHFFIIDIFAKIKKEFPQTILLLVGDNSNLYAYDGYVKRIHERVKSYGLENDIIFTGECENSAEIYQGMDLFLLPSLTEGFSLVTLEAQVSGLPCIISNGVPEEVILTNSITVCPLSDQSNWVMKVREIIRKKRERIDNGDVIISKGYGMKQETERVIRHVRELYLK